MSRPNVPTLTRRTMLGALAATSGSAALARFAGAQDASPVAGEWTYTDVLGTTVTLPRTPVRIVANIVTAAALWDLGIEPVGVFDWTVSNYPDGDHIAWGNVPADKVVNVGNADGNIEPEMLLTLDPDVVAAREAYDAKIAEFQQVAAEKAELTNLFANFDTSLIYVGGPDPEDHINGCNFRTAVTYQVGSPEYDAVMPSFGPPPPVAPVVPSRWAPGS